MGWLFTSMIGIRYLVLIFTLAVATFRRGHMILGIVGFLFPLLWVIGAVIPPVNRSYRRA
jgi:hypothetical protein